MQFLGGHQLYMKIFLYVCMCVCALGHQDTEYQVTRSPVHWDTGTIGGVRVPTYHNGVVIFLEYFKHGLPRGTPSINQIKIFRLQEKSRNVKLVLNC